jgi:hypothetical protein
MRQTLSAGLLLVVEYDATQNGSFQRDCAAPDFAYGYFFSLLTYLCLYLYC